MIVVIVTFFFLFAMIGLPRERNVQLLDELTAVGGKKKGREVSLVSAHLESKYIYA
jgi:hypothetical protein